MQGDREFIKKSKIKLQDYIKRISPLPGINSEHTLDCFVLQLRDSIHRIKYIQKLKNDMKLSAKRKDPNDVVMFDPRIAAILNHRAGKIEESFWLLFLSVHFGKNRKGGWRYAREIYKGADKIWSWERVRTKITEFRYWLDEYQKSVKKIGGSKGFSNHRKFESLSRTGAVIESYVKWINNYKSHKQLFDKIYLDSGKNPHKAFNKLYLSMKSVFRFGRLARFDYLCMVGKLGFSPIEPDQTYWHEASGVKKGIPLLFGPSKSKDQIDLLLWKIADNLDIGPFAMQILEDAICNWQKNPKKYSRFTG